jgi:hypothetical protein
MNLLQNRRFLLAAAGQAEFDTEVPAALRVTKCTWKALDAFF